MSDKGTFRFCEKCSGRAIGAAVKAGRGGSYTSILVCAIHAQAFARSGYKVQLWDQKE